VEKVFLQMQQENPAEVVDGDRIAGDFAALATDDVCISMPGK